MSKINEAKDILEQIGMPKAQQNEISALTLLALCGISKRAAWTSANRHSVTVTKGVMTFIKENYNKNYAPNTRETFRRQVLHQFVQGRVADYNPDEPDLPTNSPRAHYAISEAALKVAQSYKTKGFKKEVKEFKRTQGCLIETYIKARNERTVPVTLPDGKEFHLSPGKHNQVQVAIIECFAPRFIQEPQVLYIGDTAKKNLFIDNDAFVKINMTVTDHDKLPDVVILDSKRNWLFLIEAVTSHGPMNPKRIFELQEMFKACKTGLVFVSAFPDFSEFKRHSNDISWETEVWVAEAPDHMIHYNGDKFLGPR